MINKTAMACLVLGAATLVTGSCPAIARDNQNALNSAPLHSSTNLLAWDFDDNYGYNSGYGYGNGYGTYGRTYTRYGVSDYSPSYSYRTRYVPVYSNDYGYGYGREHGARGLVNDILDHVR